MRCGRTLDFSINNRLVRCGDDIDGTEYLCIQHRLQRIEDRLQDLDSWKQGVERRINAQLRDIRRSLNQVEGIADKAVRQTREARRL